MQECNLCGRLKKKHALWIQKSNKTKQRSVFICVDCWKDIKEVMENDNKHFDSDLVDIGIIDMEGKKYPCYESKNTETLLVGLNISMHDFTEKQNQYKIIN